MKHRRPLWTLALFARVGLSLPPLSPPKPTPIEQLIYVYAPQADWNGGFADTNVALLARLAKQRGMRVVLLDADELYFNASTENYYDQGALLNSKLKELTRQKNSIVFIGTHGGKRVTPNGKTDTSLSFEYGDLNYSNVAKGLDPNPHVKIVLMNACHGFCDVLRNTALQSGGKLVAASAGIDQEGNASTERVLTASLAQLIKAARPVRLGSEFKERVEYFLRSCEALTEKMKDRDLRESIENLRSRDENLFQLFASKGNERAKLTDRCQKKPQLTLRSGLGEQLFTFGKGEGSIVDSSGARVVLCPSFDSNSQAVFLPGVTYDASRVSGQARMSGESLSQNLEITKPSEYGRQLTGISRLDFICMPDGRWRAAIAKPRSAIDPRDDPSTDMRCRDRGHRYLNLNDCFYPDRLESFLTEMGIEKSQLEATKDDYHRQCSKVSRTYSHLKELKVDMSYIHTEGVCLREGRLYPVTSLGRRNVSESNVSH